ncbi:hypothetical protein F2P81_016730 [Scophthalmus maximus]|uniref:Uncharacterized protein n=1 Tax=Scophthalmus maximus TaxID=52904 RepID=A0A6A4SBH6_SCOMX|nr:hypothetical protein F2P81_016730 [Scophthalmus maximus]
MEKWHSFKPNAPGQLHDRPLLTSSVGSCVQISFAITLKVCHIIADVAFMDRRFALHRSTFQILSHKSSGIACANSSRLETASSIAPPVSSGISQQYSSQEVNLSKSIVNSESDGSVINECHFVWVTVAQKDWNFNAGPDTVKRCLHNQRNTAVVHLLAEMLFSHIKDLFTLIHCSCAVVKLK